MEFTHIYIGTVYTGMYSYIQIKVCLKLIESNNSQSGCFYENINNVVLTKHARVQLYNPE